MARQAAELGIEVVGYQTDLYGPAQVDDVEAAVALLRTLGPGDALSSRAAGWRRASRTWCGCTDRRRVFSRPQRERNGRGRPRRSAPGRGSGDERAVERLGTRRGRAAGVEGIDLALALAPFESEPVSVAFGRGELHGGTGERFAVGLDEPRPLQTPSGQFEVTGIGREDRHGAGGVDEHGRDAATMALGFPPRIARQGVGQRLTFHEIERGTEVGDRDGGVGLRPSLRASAMARCTSTVTWRETWYTPCGCPRGRADCRARRHPWHAAPRTQC